MLDARTGRLLQPGQRQIMTDAEWQWITSKIDGQYEHLLLASSLPFLLPHGMHNLTCDTQHRGVFGGGRRRSLGLAAERARREGADRRQPRSLGLLPTQLPRVRGACDRHRDRQAGPGAGIAGEVRRRRSSLLGFGSSTARRRSTHPHAHLGGGLLWPPKKPISANGSSWGSVIATGRGARASA